MNSLEGVLPHQGEFRLPSFSPTTQALEKPSTPPIQLSQPQNQPHATDPALDDWSQQSLPEATFDSTDEQFDMSWFGLSQQVQNIPATAFGITPAGADEQPLGFENAMTSHSGSGASKEPRQSPQQESNSISGYLDGDPFPDFAWRSPDDSIGYSLEEEDVDGADKQTWFSVHVSAEVAEHL